MEKGQQNRLKKWQDRMQRNLTAYQPILDEMDKMNSPVSYTHLTLPTILRV